MSDDQPQVERQVTGSVISANHILPLGPTWLIQIKESLDGRASISVSGKERSRPFSST
jgi:hypothetical protein